MLLPGRKYGFTTEKATVRMKFFWITFHNSGLQSELYASLLIFCTRLPRAAFRTGSHISVLQYLLTYFINKLELRYWQKSN